MKNIENEKIDEQPLPENISWGTLLDKPTKISDINRAEGEALQGIVGNIDDGVWIGDVINAALNTQEEKILGDYTFGSSGAIRVGTTNNGISISPSGILGRSGGNTTFAIDSGGNATFAGELIAAHGTLGTVTGGVIRTSSGTTRVELNSSSNGLGVISGGKLRLFLGGSVVEFYDHNENFSGNIFGVASNSIAITSNTGSAAPRLTLGSSYLDLVNADLRLECDLLARWGGSYDIGKSATRFRDLWLSRDIAFNRYVRNQVTPSSDNMFSLGTSSRRWRDLNFRNWVVGWGTTASRSFIIPEAANVCNVGTPSLPFNQVYATNVRYKSLDSFDHIKDIEAIKKIRTKKITVEEPDEVGRKKAGYIEREVWDPDTLPQDTKRGEYVDAGAITGFLIGAVKELIEKVEALEKSVGQR